jgi:prepilin-type N-terminal cleavage/methylation domain-containing protein
MIYALDHMPHRYASTARSVRSARRGFTMLELSICVGLLTVGLVLTLQLLSWIAAERRSAAYRQWALREADNLMERVTSMPWDSVTRERVESLEPAKRTERELPGGRLTCDIAESSAEPKSKRVTIEVRWKNRAGDDDAPVRITAWISRQEQAP